MTLLDAIFSGLATWRLIRGGHWERWYVDSPVNSYVWHRVGSCYRDAKRYELGDERPTPLCRGTPTCETYPA